MLELKLTRWPRETKGYTAGVLTANGSFLCNTMEDQVREIPGQPVEKWKIRGETAIPRGRYRVRLSMSPRFKRVLPELLDVPGFTGIRIHRGNTAKDTEGCILVGMPDGDDKDSWLGNSTPAEGLVIRTIRAALDAGEQVWMEIT